MAGLVLYLLSAGAQIVPGVGPVGITGVRPPVLVPVARIRGVGIGEGKIFLGLRVIGGFVRQVDFFAVLALHLFIDVGHVDDLLLIRRRRREEHHQVMAFARLRFGSAAGRQVDQVDIVDRDIGVVLLAPVLGVGAVEPGVPGGDEVAPLQDLQCFLLGGSALRKKKRGAYTGNHGPGADPLYEITA